MIRNSDEFTRRILNFPAIRPYESISFPNILSSLINSGHRISGLKSATFFTNKKNATRTIRLIESLVLFLEEIPYGNPKFQDSLVLSLSELHYIFQKVHFLLEDCARDDSRLWMLVKCEKVSSHFRVLMRAIAVALDIIPLMELDISCEVQELVDFVRKQALKSRIEVERDEVRAMTRVLRILDLFEAGIAPEPLYIKRVLDHLGITSWNECNKEVKFLESELNQECSTSEKRNAGFLSSLLAFMIYCRCTLFPDIDNNISVGRYISKDTILGLNPDDFRCPITLEIMIDPVTVSTGHTYDRSSILTWFRSGNHTCPKTGEKLLCIDLVPNHSLKKLIKKYCHDNAIPFPESGQKHEISAPADSAGSAVAERVMNLLAIYLVGKLVAGTEDEQRKSTFEIRILTKSSNFNRSYLVEAGVIPPLLNQLSSRNPEAQENSAAALLNLSKYTKSKKIIVENGGLELIVEVLNQGLKPESRQHAAGVLFYLASVEEYRRTIGRIPGSIPGLMGLIAGRSDHGKKNSLVTVLGLLMYPENHWKVLQAGLVPLLVNLLTYSQTEEIVTDTLAVLATLAEKLEGAMAIVSAGALPWVVEIFCSSGSRAAKEYSVSLLLALCINDGADVVPVLVKNPSLMVALYSLLTDGTSRSRKKASLLIRILLAFNDNNFSGLMAAAMPQEHFVHVW